MQALKFRDGHSIRRDSLPANQLSYASLLDTFRDLFGRPLHNETLRYRDDESEWVDLSSDRELREALRLNQAKTLEFMTVRSHTQFENAGRRGWRRHHEESQRQQTPEERTFSPRSGTPVQGRYSRRPFRHPATCDNCNAQIVGDRHKCNDCLDYDLCGECISKSNTVHPGHTFTILARSYSRWHHHQPERAQRSLHTHDHVERREQEITIEDPASAAKDVEAQTEEVTTIEKEEIEQRVVPDLNNQDIQNERAKDNEPAQHIEERAEVGGVPLIKISSLMKRLETLANMGFKDKQKNVRLLLAYGGDTLQVLDKLMAE